jgi:hypothetical protein
VEGQPLRRRDRSMPNWDPCTHAHRPHTLCASRESSTTKKKGWGLQKCFSICIYVYIFWAVIGRIQRGFYLCRSSLCACRCLACTYPITHTGRLASGSDSTRLPWICSVCDFGAIMSEFRTDKMGGTDMTCESRVVTQKLLKFYIKILFLTLCEWSLCRKLAQKSDG